MGLFQETLENSVPMSTFFRYCCPASDGIFNTIRVEDSDKGGVDNHALTYTHTHGLYEMSITIFTHSHTFENFVAWKNYARRPKIFYNIITTTPKIVNV